MRECVCVCVCDCPLMSSTSSWWGGGQRLTAKATQPLSVIVWWRPDSDSGLLVLELQPRTGSIIFCTRWRSFICCFFFVFFCFYIRHSPLTMGTLSRYFVLWAFQDSRFQGVCVCVRESFMVLLTDSFSDYMM